ncbi:MAG: dihydropteroate synthase [Saprospiraceae bacterium]|nr:dihydropteroate synthase [Saprospiraceae bacterium]MCF8251626.1 dihydropteroate synthase [Saprospiraceae bacterium]MCF8281347.1 dihydropteroate synthase [Bacteroidales bacterium]MCF8312284.1 dihydropteroate synthase [Saprospiraceae bacterium]MCF8441992.1 dihydropteroate synthase [Saprospiraceae bacterium]
MIFEKQTINCRGRLLDLSSPIVMGILNLTPDSFFDGGQYETQSAMLHQVEKMLNEGAAILDVGGISSKPGAVLISEEEELARVLPALQVILREFPDAVISVDTFRAKVAVESVAAGASIVNDIYAGRFEENMLETIAKLGVPYIIMHMQGEPANMQKAPDYEDVTKEVLHFFIKKMGQLRALGVKDIIIDPGFGFGKTVAHNYQLLNNLHVFRMTDLPILAGISRKSMICRVLNVPPAAALNGTTALHMVALQQGARLLRAHDVKEAVEVIQIWKQLEQVKNAG